jgi:hypothetical protein
MQSFFIMPNVGLAIVLTFGTQRKEQRYVLSSVHSPKICP